MSQKYETSFFAGFDDTDLGGVVFFGNYYRIAHKCLESFIRDQGIDWEYWFQNSEFLVPLAHSEADYKKPLFAGNTYKARVSVENISNSSIIFCYSFLNQKDEECASLKTVHVFVDKNTFQSVSVPEKVKTALS